VYGIFEGVIRINEKNMKNPALSQAAKLPAANSDSAAPKCSNCGSALSQDSKFCMRCGSPVPEKAEPETVKKKTQPDASELKCPSCGSALSQDSKFCSRCGFRVPEVSEKTADQIKKLKQLLDDGVLTQQEFDDKKKLLAEKQQS
jgi:uncharacterized membrane protein YvbJ